MEEKGWRTEEEREEGRKCEAFPEPEEVRKEEGGGGGRERSTWGRGMALRGFFPPIFFMAL